MVWTYKEGFDKIEGRKVRLESDPIGYGHQVACFGRKKCRNEEAKRRIRMLWPYSRQEMMDT